MVKFIQVFHFSLKIPMLGTWMSCRRGLLCQQFSRVNEKSRRHVEFAHTSCQMSR